MLRFISIPAIACTMGLMPIHCEAQIYATRDRVGDVLQVVLPLAAVGLSLKNDDMEGLKEFGLSAVVSQSTTEVMKYALNSRRPNGSSHGFPSGHTSIAFVSASYVQQRYGWEPAIPMYGLAMLTGYSRVRTHNHYVKDVLGGAAVGIASAAWLTHPLSDRTRAAVGYGGGGLAVHVSHQW